MANRTNHPGRKSDREWYHALRKAVHELVEATGVGKSKRTKALHLLARKLVAKALGGDVTALKELGDRLDGKPCQSVTIGADSENPLASLAIEFIKPPTTDKT